jgi:hypothetical protein
MSRHENVGQNHSKLSVRGVETQGDHRIPTLFTPPAASTSNEVGLQYLVQRNLITIARFQETFPRRRTPLKTRTHRDV